MQYSMSSNIIYTLFYVKECYLYNILSQEILSILYFMSRNVIYTILFFKKLIHFSYRIFR